MVWINTASRIEEKKNYAKHCAYWTKNEQINTPV